MKKIVYLLALSVVAASLAFAGPQMKITPQNLPQLKGTWEGMLSLGLYDVANCPAKLEILNDTVPVKMKLTLMNVPDYVGSKLGIMGGTDIFEDSDGQITSQGTLIWVAPTKNVLEITLVGKKKLDAWYYFRGVKGEANLRKK